MFNIYIIFVLIETTFGMLYNPMAIFRCASGHPLLSWGKFNSNATKIIEYRVLTRDDKR